ncbi:peroxisomal biogenesis factor 5 [Pseudohyphozyma bogoriensis]|nr:peroxisomal biogenesis factor 5 [Pseudohyphozyma bogoriensis]
MSAAGHIPSLNALIWISVKPLFRIIIPGSIGFLLTKKGIFPPTGPRIASMLIMNCTLPALLFSKLVPSFNSSNISAMGPIILVGFFYQLYDFLCSIAVRATTQTPRKFRYGFVAAFTFSNWGDLPTAVAQALTAQAPFGGTSDENLAIAYIAIFIMVNYVSMFPLQGIYLVKMDYVSPVDARLEIEIEDRGGWRKWLNRVRRGKPMMWEMEEEREKMRREKEEKGKGKGKEADEGGEGVAVKTLGKNDANLDATLLSEITEIRTPLQRISSTTSRTAPPSVPFPNPSPTPSIILDPSNDPRAYIRVLHSIKSFLLSLVSPPTVTLLTGLVIALVPVLKSLFVLDASSWHPTAPDGTAPLAFIYDTATFVGAASVPLGLLVLGSSMAKMQIPRPISKLPLWSIFWMAVLKMAILPLVGFFFVQGLTYHTGMSYGYVPTYTQIFGPENGDNNADLLAAYLIAQALVGGGAECGPVNPLAQMSKLYQQDRSLQQDHYGSQAGPSSSRFRQAGGPTQTPDEAARFFSRSHSHSPAPQPFDLSPLNRALTPQASAGAAPAWAQAFQHQNDAGGIAIPGRQNGEFGKAFDRPLQHQHQQPNQWSGDFMRHHQQQQQQAGRVEGQQHQQMAVPQPQSYGMGMGMMRRSPMMFQNQGVGMPMQAERSDVDMMQVSGQQASTDWESAFLAQEAASALSTAQSQPATQFNVSDTQSRDALARTAAELVSTVESLERQRAAGEGDSTNTKFANSSFMDLMRKLRDGEVAVEGDKVVEQIGPTVDKGKGRAFEPAREEEGRVGAAPPSFGLAPSVGSGPTLAQFAQRQHSYAEQQGLDAEMIRERERGYRQADDDLWAEEDTARAQREAKGKGKARMQFQGKARMQFQGDGGMMEEDDGVEDGSFLLRDEKSSERMHMDTSVPLASSYWDEDFDASMIVGGHGRQSPTGKVRELSAQQKEWETLQADWDNFEATATGIKPVSETAGAASTSAQTINGYTFSQNNPYYEETTRTHSMHTQHATSAPRTTFDSILEHEAAVQRDPQDASAWLALGIKQQENEREELAIKALLQAASLDPTSGAAYLALAVSYTNENERSSAYEAVDKWVDSLARTGGYAREVENYRDMFGTLPMSSHERHEYLTGMLIQLAQSRAEVGEVDADVQIGLGVLFNTSEEYEKASDCFGSALGVRPDDPLLFNRLGATLANSGKTDLSIQYYLEALELHPAYVRARFNLAVANMNLGQYEQAVEHLMTSLSIQEQDVQLRDGDDDNSPDVGVTSQTLWDSLNIALLMMHRGDLAVHTSTRDLNALRSHFSPA